MVNKRLLVTLTGIIGAIFIPTLSLLPKILNGNPTVSISTNHLFTTFFGVLVLALLTGAIQKKERILFTIISLIFIGFPLFILKQQIHLLNLATGAWVLFMILSLILIVIWVKQMINDDKN